jgi:hypothetical protein
MKRIFLTWMAMFAAIAAARQISAVAPDKGVTALLANFDPAIIEADEGLRLYFVQSQNMIFMDCSVIEDEMLTNHRHWLRRTCVCEERSDEAIHFGITAPLAPHFQLEDEHNRIKTLKIIDI